MYPPSEESDCFRQERNRRQGIWVIAIFWVCFGLFSILKKHWLLMGTGQMVIGVGYVANEILAKKAKKWRILLFTILAAIILLLITLDLFFGK